MDKYVYPILTLGLASFVTYSGYCAYKHSQQQMYGECPYNVLEARLIELLHNEARRNRSYAELCELSTAVSRREYFMKKMQAANAFINSGDQSGGVRLLIEAMAACSRPVALLECMADALPAGVYRKLIEKLSSLT